jgi:CspA family cold shock protein
LRAVPVLSVFDFGVLIMPQGNIKKLVHDRGFGFISGDRSDVFFHMSSVEGVSFEELQEGQLVEYEIDEEEQPRRRNQGPRAKSVKPA